MEEESRKPAVDPRFDINVPDVALIYEGGGMRASYTSGVVVTLLERGIHFGHVYGISAGASNTVNYVSQDPLRAKASFVDNACDPQFGGLGSFLTGKGFFNAHYLYEGVVDNFEGVNAVMGFRWDDFCANPADVHIEAFDWDSGETTAWTKADMPNAHEALVRVRASSSMPIFMPPTVVDGHTYLDGGIGSSWGILLEAAERDGFDRFFIVRTQQRGYRKKPMSKSMCRLFNRVFREHPLVAERTIERWHHYNDLCDRIDRLEAEGRACVFYPETMPVSNRETDFVKLKASLEAGLAQARREAPIWENWL